MQAVICVCALDVYQKPQKAIHTSASHFSWRQRTYCSLAFTNCFKLERVNGPRCIVLWVGKAPVKEAFTLFIDFVLAAVNLFHCP